MALLRILVAAVILVVGVTTALPSSVSSDGVRVTLDADDSTSMGANMKLMFRIYQDCTLRAGGFTPCLKMRAINFFDRVAKLDSINLVESVALVRVPAVAGEDRTSRALSENELEASLPTDIEKRDSQLSSLLLERVSRFFRSYTLQVSLPEVTEGDLARGLEDGRGKMKKMMGMMMMMGGALKMMLLMMLKIKGLFFLAKKALIIAKIALVLTLAGMMKKMMSGGKESSSHGWSSGGGGGGGGYGGGSSSGGWDKRAFDYAHELAYGAQRQEAVSANSS